jgi:hypothetical protein
MAWTGKATGTDREDAKRRSGPAIRPPMGRLAARPRLENRPGRRMAHEAGVFFFAFCLKAAGVQKDHDEIGCPFGSRHKQAMNRGIPGCSRAIDHDPIGLNRITNVFVDDLPTNASRLSPAKTGSRFALTRPCGSGSCSSSQVPRWRWAEVPCVISGEVWTHPALDVMLLYGAASSAADQAALTEA